MNTGTSGIDLTQVNDANTAYPKDDGIGFFYLSTTASNTPGAIHGFIIACRSQGTYIAQLWLNMTGLNGKLYARQGRTTGSWNEWVLVNN